MADQSGHRDSAVKDPPVRYCSHRTTARSARVLVGCLLPLGLLLVAGGVAFYLIKTRPKPKQKPPAPTATLVETMAVRVSREQVAVHVMGEVVPAQEITLQAQVSGEVIWVSEGFLPGGLFAAGEKIAQLEPRDYELAIEQRQSEVVGAEHELKLEFGYQAIAQHEWELLNAGDEASELDLELALRKPHLKKAEAVLAASKAALENAKLDLARTAIKAPFNAFVQVKNVDLGAQVGLQTQLGHLVGTDECWVQTSMPVDRLGWITIADEPERKGSAAKVIYQTGGAERLERAGYTGRLMGELEREGRMARVLVVVKDPLDLESPAEQRRPMLIGAYVQVEIEGKILEDVISIPRTALRDNETVWVMDGEGALAIRPVEIRWRDKERVLIGGGIEGGERVVVSNIAAPIVGMELREATPAQTVEGVERDERR